ncbi:MAG: DNA mismatch repair endonuclease MutL [Dehalococcoidia bacterium]
MRIKILTQDIISKIAAGEVIENPSSVIKELIDNSIDANSSKIEIEIKNGGKDYIRLSDNGIGILDEDLKIAFSRHATSKLSDISDVNKIQSMGFRGEALPSIATVSNVLLVSKTINQSHAYGINVNFGNITKYKPESRVDGTTVTVTDLFGNMPARRKFLKSSRSESKKNYDLIKKYSLCYPNIKFIVISDGRKYIETPGTGNLKDLFPILFDINTSNSMIKINHNSNDLELTGYVSNVNIRKSSNVNVHCFINNRVIKNRIFHYAIERAYDSLLVKGDHPICVLNIELDPNLIDLNVHPSKNEIKIREERELFSIIEKQIRLSLINSEISSDNTTIDFFNINSQSLNNKDSNKLQNIRNIRSIENTVQYPQNSFNDFFTSNVNKIDLLKEFILLGQVNNSYIVGEYKNEISIIDQHAAHERVNYEKLIYSTEKKIVSQELLNPIILNLSAEEDIWVQDNIEFFINNGFEIESFGIANQIIIRKLPLQFTKGNLEQKIYKYIIELKNNSKNSEDERKKTLACHASIEFGDSLTNAEIFNLIEELSSCQEPWTCPHGRPTLIKIDNQQLLKLFQRV